ncbi:MAG: (d)CMP kinase [Elioraea tepidiphila]
MAQKVAKTLGYVYIDTGAMYRSITWKALHEGIDFANHEAIAEIARLTTIALIPPADLTGKQHVLVDGHDVTAEIRLPEVSQRVSGVASLPAVREVLTAQQQAMGAAGGVVMDGRDIGTVVFPEAAVKLFVTASPEERARRRFLELRGRGIAADPDQVLAEIRDRDAQDANRPVAPLKPAPDAIVIDTTALDADAAFAVALAEIGQRLAGR